MFNIKSIWLTDSIIQHTNTHVNIKLKLQHLSVIKENIPPKVTAETCILKPNMLKMFDKITSVSLQ